MSRDRDRGDWELIGAEPDYTLFYWAPEGKLSYKGDYAACKKMLMEWQLRYENISKPEPDIVISCSPDPEEKLSGLKQAYMQTYDSEPVGVKYDSGKPELHLLPPTALNEIAKVLSFGAKKYSPGNFAHGIHYSRLISAAMRHLNTFNAGEDKDAESSLSHVAHAACCLMFLIHMENHKPEMDDRWIKKILTE